MLKRTIFLSTPLNATVHYGQLVISSIDKDESNFSKIPIEDVGNVIIDNQRVKISIPALNELADHNVGVIICDNKGMPKSMLNPLESNTLQGQRYKIQLEATQPSKKIIWQQLVESKIRNQSELLNRLGKDGSLLKPYYNNVKSGDSDNREGIAARIYWSKLFNGEFTRSRDGFPPNNLLNYGYAILRAATARAIVSAGLLPALGIHHHNRSNAFPLADDFMEPFRPFVDRTVYELYINGVSHLDKGAKSALISLLYCDISIDDKLHPLSVALEMLCTSAIKIMSGEGKKLKAPCFIKT